MKANILLILLSSLGLLPPSGLYSLHFTTLEGNNKSMQDFQGKKLLVLVLPVTNSSADSTFLHRVDSFSRRYADSVTFVGVPAQEFGYQGAKAGTLLSYYRGILGPQIWLSQGMFVERASGSRQSALFSWLTHSNQNLQFDQEVKGVGQKYFIDGSGNLYGALSAAVTLRDSLFLKMLY
jgi:glutathione peroxidase-family protein